VQNNLEIVFLMLVGTTRENFRKQKWRLNDLKFIYGMAFEEFYIANSIKCGREL
jgi:hypothetical protein